MKMICISSMGESAQSYVESTTVLSDKKLTVFPAGVSPKPYVILT